MARAGDEAEIHRLYTKGVPEGLANAPGDDVDIHHPAPVYFAPEAQGRLWVADTGEKLVAMIGVVHDRAEVGIIRRLRIAPGWRGSELVPLLLRPLLAYCRERGYLKVLFDMDIEIAPQQVLHIFEREGLHRGRRRADPARELIEFYVDLYQASAATPEGGPVRLERPRFNPGSRAKDAASANASAADQRSNTTAPGEENQPRMYADQR